MVRIIVAAKGVPRVQYPVPGKIQMVVLDKIIQVGGAKVVLFGAKCVFQIKLVNAKLVGHHHIGIVRNALSIQWCPPMVSSHQISCTSWNAMPFIS